ncbi:Putative multidrug resistance protein MdtD [Streptomyces microflavus]
MLGMALAAIDGTIVSTAVPQIVGDLGGFTVFSWLFSGYLLAVTVTLPVYGKLSDTFGRKPVLIAGIILFLAGSLLCAAAWNMAALIAFRVIQGLGGGALQGTVQTIAADLYPLKERPRIQAKLSTVWATSAVAGLVGGLLAGYADWRWIFLINLPVGAVALWLVVRHLHEPARPRPKTRPRIDWAGALAVFATGTLLLTALVQGGVAWPWLSAPSLGLFAASAALALDRLRHTEASWGRPASHLRPHRLPDRMAGLPSPPRRQALHQEQPAPRLPVIRRQHRLLGRPAQPGVRGLDTEPARGPLVVHPHRELRPRQTPVPHRVGSQLRHHQRYGARHVRHRPEPPLPQLPHHGMPRLLRALRRGGELPGRRAVPVAAQPEAAPDGREPAPARRPAPLRSSSCRSWEPSTRSTPLTSPTRAGSVTFRTQESAVRPSLGR